MNFVLRERLKTDTALLIAPGVYDGLTARLAERAGFECIYMTGYGTAASYGFPDLGWLTLTEMANNARKVSRAVKIPVIADADTGYGDADNVERTVREYVHAGVSALHIEDQDWPKKCGHMQGKSLISTNDMADKIRSAVSARAANDLQIIARTDAIAVEGFDAAIDRARAYGDAGADILFVEAPNDMAEMEAIPARLPEWPHIINMAPRTPSVSAEDLEQLGYRIAIYPGVCLVAAFTECSDQLDALKQTGVQRNLDVWKDRFEEMNEMLGAESNTTATNT